MQLDIQVAKHNIIKSLIKSRGTVGRDERRMMIVMNQKWLIHAGIRDDPVHCGINTQATSQPNSSHSVLQRAFVLLLSAHVWHPGPFDAPSSRVPVIKMKKDIKNKRGIKTE